MQLNPLAAAQPAAPQAAPGTVARVVAGDLAKVPVGALLEATVTAATPREATVVVNGQPLALAQPAGAPLQQGAVLLLRVPPGAARAATPSVELSAPPAQQPPPAAAPGRARVAAPVPADAPRTAVVDVLDARPDGTVRVRIDGGDEQPARTTEPLAAGQRFVLQVERAANGVVLRPAPDTPALPREVATAVLRAPAADTGATIKPLRAELDALTAAPPKGTAPAPPAVRDAATAVRATLDALVPRDGRTPDAAQLQRFVENGGQLFEAKLARAAEGSAAPPRPGSADAPAPAPQGPATPAKLLEALAARPNAPTPDAPTAPEGEPVPAPVAEKPAARDALAQKPDAAVPRAPAELGEPAERAAPAPERADARDAPADLKGDLLKLLRAAHDLGGTARLPAAEAALHTIESQQAANVLAQANGTPYYLQIPFPDGAQWRTVRLALEPERQPDDAPSDPASRFRVFMHVPLSELGETYIDAGLSGGQFRATIYLDSPVVRERVSAALSELHTELAGEGFSEVLLDVRATGDLPDARRKATGALRAGRPDTVSVLDVRA